MGDGAEDPGWRRALLAALIPGFALRRLGRSPADGLTLLRTVFVAFCIAIALVGVVVATLDGIGDEFGQVAVAPVLVGVLVVGFAGQLTLSLVRRPLDCTGPEALARSYVSRRFFTRLAFSEGSGAGQLRGLPPHHRALAVPRGSGLQRRGVRQDGADQNAAERRTRAPARRRLQPVARRGADEEHAR